MTDRELIVSKRICQYTDKLMPPQKYGSDWYTNPPLSAACSAVRSVVYIRCGVYKTKDARKLPDAVFNATLDEVLPEKDEG